MDDDVDLEKVNDAVSIIITMVLLAAFLAYLIRDSL